MGRSSPGSQGGRKDCSAMGVLLGLKKRVCGTVGGYRVTVSIQMLTTFLDYVSLESFCTQL